MRLVLVVLFILRLNEVLNLPIVNNWFGSFA